MTKQPRVRFSSRAQYRATTPPFELRMHAYWERIFERKLPRTWDESLRETLYPHSSSARRSSREDAKTSRSQKIGHRQMIWIESLAEPC
jgi:hypothetical protein